MTPEDQLRARIDETQDERIQREADESVEDALVLGIDGHAARMKECLAALRMAGIPMNLGTAEALHELSLDMSRTIQGFLEDD